MLPHFALGHKTATSTKKDGDGQRPARVRVEAPLVSKARALWSRGGTIGVDKHVHVEADVLLERLPDETRTMGAPLRRVRLEIHCYGRIERGSLYAVLWPDEADTLPSDVELNAPAPIPCTDVYVRRNGLLQPLGVPEMSVLVYWDPSPASSPHLLIAYGSLLRAEVTLDHRAPEGHRRLVEMLRPSRLSRVRYVALETNQ